VRSLPDLWWFFAAFLLFNDGVETVIYFSAIFAREVVGFSMGETVIMFMAVQITALAGSVIFGHIADRTGPKPALVATLVLWCAVCAAAFAATTRARFWVVALVAGLGLGSVQACARGLMRLFVPAGRDAEYYGFFAIAQKYSAVIGPLAYGAIASLWDDQRIAIASVMIFFVAGLLLLARVNVARGAEAARALNY
jgi:UMF1 family MFS transporter